MRQKFSIKVLFDRRKELATKGVGKVEIYIYLGRSEKKYITINSLSASMWKKYEKSIELAQEVEMYNSTVISMIDNHELLTVENLNRMLGRHRIDKKSFLQVLSSPTGFIDFMKECLSKEKLSPGTRRRKEVVIRSIATWGKMKRFGQVSISSLVAYDTWLRKDGSRTDVTINNYHKTLKVWIRKALNSGYIQYNPYADERCHFVRGKSPERQPLSEDELVRLRELTGLGPMMDKARDVFVFMAYTGLSYSDYFNFDFHKTVEQHGDTYFINGRRIKTANAFYTPILPV